MPEELPMPKKSLKQLEKENRKMLKNNKYIFQVSRVVTNYLKKLKKGQKTVVFLTFFIYNKKQIETKRKNREEVKQ